MKGVFNLRPPTAKLCPVWDLEKVFKTLQNYPFEPLHKTSLKYNTYKTVFLVAITTFRRCSDLQSLRIGEGNISVHSDGILFIRQGLSKQDRQSHYESRIWVPAFPGNKQLDPMRALAIYLKKTEAFRREEKSDELKLFLCFIEPHRPVSSQTIGKWTVNTIKLAYDYDIKVTAHSTRAIGPSWALFKGASMSSIIEAVDWKTESTFTKFYFRNVDTCVSK